MGNINFLILPMKIKLKSSQNNLKKAMNPPFVDTLLTQALQNFKKLEFLFQVGLKRNSPKEKIDILAGFNNGSIDTYAPLVKNLLKDYWPSGCFSECDDSIRFDLPEGKGGIAICDSALLLVQIKKWIEGKELMGQQRSWAIGYWLPEAMLGDLTAAKVLYDKKNIFSQIKELTFSYPDSLSRSISLLCIDEIKQKIPLIYKLQESSPVEFDLCLSNIISSLIRLSFAQSHQYLRGFKSLADQVQSLRSSDLLFYELAIALSKKKRIKSLIKKINDNISSLTEYSG
jgi:hypothetical protein